MDRRFLRSNGAVAHKTLRGLIRTEKFVDGDWMQIGRQTTPILAKPKGPRDRELLYGQDFCVIDVQGSYSFGFAKRDGYCGYVLSDSLLQPVATTHAVKVRQTYKKETPELKTFDRHLPLSFGSRLRITDEKNGWAQISMPAMSGQITNFFVPNMHIQSVDEFVDDPVIVAELFVGTPYLWGGNSCFGIDCSGLIQAAYLACNRDCPGDSDLQEKTLGKVLGNEETYRRGDLIFWNGHVAIAIDAKTLIHANAHHMAVTIEPIATTIDRIFRQGGGGVTSRKRP